MATGKTSSTKYPLCDDADIQHYRVYWRTYFRVTPVDDQLRRASQAWSNRPTGLLKSAMSAVASLRYNEPFERLADRVTAELHRLVEIDRQHKELEAKRALVERLAAEQQAMAEKAAADEARRLAEEAALNKPSKTVEEEIRALIQEGFRARAKRQHPDHGGTHEGMLMVNAAVERLRRLTSH
jgi:hypothetical protein